MICRVFVVLACVGVVAWMPVSVTAQSRVEYFDNGNCTGLVRLAVNVPVATDEEPSDCFPIAFGEIEDNSAFRVSCGATQATVSVMLASTCESREEFSPLTSMEQDEDECCVRLSDFQSVRVLQCDGTATSCGLPDVQDKCTSHSDCVDNAACLQPTSWAPRSCTPCSSCLGIAATGTLVTNTQTPDACPSYCSSNSSCFGLGPTCSAATTPEYCSSPYTCNAVSTSATNRYCDDDSEWLLKMSNEFESAQPGSVDVDSTTPALPEDTNGICRSCPDSCMSYHDVWTSESNADTTGAGDVAKQTNGSIVCPMSCNPNGPCYLMPDSSCRCDQCVRTRVLPVVILFLFVFLCVLTLCLTVLVRRGSKHQAGYRKAHKSFITMGLALVTFSGFALAEKSKEWWQHDLTMVTVFTALVSLIIVFTIPVLSLDSCTPCAESDFRRPKDGSGKVVPQTREHRVCFFVSWILYAISLIISTVVLAQVSAHEILPGPGVLLSAGFLGALSLQLMALCVHLSNIRVARYTYKNKGIALKSSNKARSGLLPIYEHRSPRVADSNEGAQDGGNSSRPLSRVMEEEEATMPQLSFAEEEEENEREDQTARMSVRGNNYQQQEQGIQSPNTNSHARRHTVGTSALASSTAAFRNESNIANSNSRGGSTWGRFGLSPRTNSTNQQTLREENIAMDEGCSTDDTEVDEENMYNNNNGNQTQHTIRDEPMRVMLSSDVRTEDRHTGGGAGAIDSRTEIAAQPKQPRRESTEDKPVVHSRSKSSFFRMKRNKRTKDAEVSSTSTSSPSTSVSTSVPQANGTASSSSSNSRPEFSEKMPAARGAGQRNADEHLMLNMRHINNTHDDNDENENNYRPSSSSTTSNSSTNKFTNNHNTLTADRYIYDYNNSNGPSSHRSSASMPSAPQVNRSNGPRGNGHSYAASTGGGLPASSRTFSSSNQSNNADNRHGVRLSASATHSSLRFQTARAQFERDAPGSTIVLPGNRSHSDHYAIPLAEPTTSSASSVASSSSQAYAEALPVQLASTPTFTSQMM